MIGDPQDMPVPKILGILWGPLEMPLETCNKCGPGELRHRPPHGRDTARVGSGVELGDVPDPVLLRSHCADRACCLLMPDGEV